MSGHHMPWQFALAMVLLGAALFDAALCRWFPYANCWCCKGTGKHYAKDGKHFRHCKWWPKWIGCEGTGKRLRLGRKIWNYFARSRRDAS